MKRIKHPRLPTCTGFRFHIFALGSKLCVVCKGVCK